MVKEMHKSTIQQLFRQTNEFARNRLHTNIMYLKASADVKIITFLEKNLGVDVAVDHKMDLLR